MRISHTAAVPIFPTAAYKLPPWALRYLPGLSGGALGSLLRLNRSALLDEALEAEQAASAWGWRHAVPGRSAHLPSALAAAAGAVEAGAARARGGRERRQTVGRRGLSGGGLSGGGLSGGGSGSGDRGSGDDGENSGGGGGGAAGRWADAASEDFLVFTEQGLSRLLRSGDSFDGAGGGSARLSSSSSSSSSSWLGRLRTLNATAASKAWATALAEAMDDDAELAAAEADADAEAAAEAEAGNAAGGSESGGRGSGWLDALGSGVADDASPPPPLPSYFDPATRALRELADQSSCCADVRAVSVQAKRWASGMGGVGGRDSTGTSLGCVLRRCH